MDTKNRSSARSFLVQRAPTAQAFSFGHSGIGAMGFNIPLQDPTKEVGDLEPPGRHVTPLSLHVTQRRDRPGDVALRNVAAHRQVP